MPEPSPTTLALLRKARDLIAQGWTQLTPARDRLGEPCSPHSIGAVRWCITGAVDRALGRYGHFHHYLDALSALFPNSSDTGADSAAIRYNDLPHTTQADVLALIDQAIQSLEGGHDVR